jgi:transcription elongation GreA/GreB family factor
MSRAFVKESDDDLTAGELPERPVPEHANYVTPHGMEQLRMRVRDLSDQHEQLKAIADDDSEAKRKLREVERDQRYFNAQLERAEVVDPAGHPPGEVRFGATVKLKKPMGALRPSTSSVTMKPMFLSARSAGVRRWRGR